MPTSPAYIVQVSLLVPALVKLGIMVEAAHMFALYFAILSAITPPVALAVYAAGGISRAGLWESGVEALKLGATGYIIPFMFAFGPALLMIGTPLEIVLTAATAIVGVVALAAGMMGYAVTPLAAWRRVAMAAAAITLIKPGLASDALGGALIVLALLPDLVAFARAREQASGSRG
jgi:TRAP-type uncharacterized transport system fused permease subunit